jgi:hypothetical protein
MPENSKILKGFDYSKIKDLIKLGKFEKNEKIEGKLFSEIVKRGFEKDGFIFKSDKADFLLKGNLLKFKESESTDYIYIDVNGIGVPVEDTNTSYDILFELFIFDEKNGKEIWRCKVSEGRETDYPEALIEKMIKACLKTFEKKGYKIMEKDR